MKRTSTIAALVAILKIIGIAGSDAADYPAPSDIQLKTSDLSGSVSLTDVDRKAFANECFTRRTALFANFTKDSAIIKPDDLQQLKSDVDETFPRFCGCLERGLESGLSRLQFLMAETMIGQGVFISYPGTPMPPFEALKEAATKGGMSSNDFETARQKFRLHASHSAEACYLVLWGPMLARRTGMPEYRSYSGPPAPSK